jgi:hypothetical protein
VSFSGDLTGAIDTDLARIGCSRRVVLAVPQFAGLRALLAGTDMLATVPDYAASALIEGSPQLRADDAPFEIKLSELSMVWNASTITIRQNVGCARKLWSTCRLHHRGIERIEVQIGLAQVDRQVRHGRHGRDLEIHLDHPATVIAGVVDHVHQHRAGAHGAAFTGEKGKPDGFVQ